MYRIADRRKPDNFPQRPLCARPAAIYFAWQPLFSDDYCALLFTASDAEEVFASNDDRIKGSHFAPTLADMD